MRGRFLASLVVATAAAFAASCGAGPTQLHVYVWTDYLEESVVAAFEKEFGARVVETNFASNEELRAKLQAGAAGYDLVCPTDYTVAQLVRDGLLQELDLANVPNLRHVEARFRDPAYDPGNRHSVPYQWGVTGIGYRKSAFPKPPSSWADLLDTSRLAPHKGRVSMLNDVRELVGAALLLRGRSPNSADAAEIAEAGRTLLAQKPFVAKYDSDTPADSLLAKETVIAHCWSGQVANVQVEDPDLGFLVPEEGTLVYVDNWAVPKGAAHKELAERFVDFLLRPAMAAKTVNAMRYASVNEAAKPLVKPEILAGIAYEDGKGRTLHHVEEVGDAAQHYDRVFVELKSE